MAHSLDRRIQSRLATLRTAGLSRQLPLITNRLGPRYHLNGREVVGFCGNDYLGFASDPVSISTHHQGSSGARLVSGESPELRLLERDLGYLVQKPDSVLFPSGFQANVGALSALIADTDVVYSDQLNHASLIDGLRLTRAARYRVGHLQPPPIERPIPEHIDAVTWWILESTFSMDGDQPDPNQLRTAIDDGLCIYLDEAHSLGLYNSGSGFASQHALQPAALLGTFGKAFGCAGAFVAASEDVCHWLRTRARSTVFSTAISPPQLALLRHALDRVTGPVGDQRRRQLRENIHHLNELLGFASDTPIYPLIVGSNQQATDISADLVSHGIHVQAIRPPTVPDGTARLRVTLSAAHRSADIEHLVTELHRAFARAQVALARPRHHAPSASPTECNAPIT